MLPNLEPVEMFVWYNDDNEKRRRHVLGEFNGKYVALIGGYDTFMETSTVELWDNAEPIPKKVKVTTQELAKKWAKQNPDKLVSGSGSNMFNIAKTFSYNYELSEYKVIVAIDPVVTVPLTDFEVEI